MINWLEKNRPAAIILTILIATEIFYFSSIPGGRISSRGINGIAIMYHFIAFFLFNFFLTISIIGNKKIKIPYLVFPIIISIIYAFLDEFHQIFVPFRAATIKDILVDSLGILFATAIYVYSKKNQ